MLGKKGALHYKKIREHLSIAHGREAIIYVNDTYRDKRNLEGGCLYVSSWTIIHNSIVFVIVW